MDSEDTTFNEMVNSYMYNKIRIGHRQRLRARFLAEEADSHSDETLLELLLTFSIARKDVKPIAQELIRVFGNLSQVLAASPEELYKVKGIEQASITLLKAIHFIRSGSVATGSGVTALKGSDVNQQKLFENLPDDKKSDLLTSGTKNKKPKVSVPSNHPIKESGVAPISSIEDAYPKEQRLSKRAMKTTSTNRNIRRKFQVSNGYLLEFEQLARILHFLLEHRDEKRINRKVLIEDSGLAERQVESLVSMGTAMGLIKPSVQVLTPVGLLIAKHDIFIEKAGSLEWCHYIGAGSYRNLIWFEIFNHILTNRSPMTQEEWNKQLRDDLTGQYTKRTISKSLYEEVRFVVDAYLERKFSKLGLLHHDSTKRLYIRRYLNCTPLVLCAMVYDFCESRNAQLYQVSEMAATPGSPAIIFGLDATSFREQIEGLHDRGWLRYETTHNLDQIRLKPGFSAINLLTAHFEDREPHEGIEPPSGGIFQ